MPYQIDPKCSEKETICEDSCPYGAIEEVKTEGASHFQIDPELCTDCGACALACPEAAIQYAQGVTRSRLRNPAARTVAQTLVSSSAHHVASAAPVEVPEGSVIVNGKPERWALLMAACCD
jgi:Fe-S-cluster-containing hydrogenase component 2